MALEVDDSRRASASAQPDIWMSFIATDLSTRNITEVAAVQPQEQKTTTDSTTSQTAPADNTTSSPGGERVIGDYPIQEFADGWTKVSKNEMEEGKLRDLVNEFGRELILGEFDANKLSMLMKAVEPTDEKSLTESLESINHELKKMGLQLEVKLDQDGRVNQISMKEIFEPDKWQTALTANADGSIQARNYRVSLDSPTGPLESRSISADRSSFLLAKKVSPLACP